VGSSGQVSVGPKASQMDELRELCCLYSSNLNPKSFTAFSY